jgi:four helix bundle protein
MATKTEKIHAKKRELLKASIDAGVLAAVNGKIPTEARRVYRLVRAIAPGTPFSPGELRALDWSALVQLARAVSSIGANMVEGDAKSDPVDRLRFYRTSRGSAYEAVYWGEILNVDFIKDLRDLADECDFALSELLETFGDIGEA